MSSKMCSFAYIVFTLIIVSPLHRPIQAAVIPAPTTTRRSTITSVSVRMTTLKVIQATTTTRRSTITSVSVRMTTPKGHGSDNGKPLAIGLSVGAAVLILIIIAVVSFLIMRKRSAATGTTQQLVTEIIDMNGGINNLTADYDEVGLDLSQVNPAVNSDSDNQPNDGVYTYENIGGDIQAVGGEYEMVRQGEEGSDHHLYTSLRKE